ncbi:GNAT family N-acetyltransferase [Sphingomonas hengshuiensis]|uniref:GCN5 family acetyltransferase n=1 Tax=Sphingomonas hengshuiensis TaxID=1609977 RepID=A0A7U5CUM9_9SPHN|nr:GNAT family N-acetyltransferase [Sphingomonas hengshuiensis]AJP70907.1 GCN5 family acetyltransferase [Sphingomonas hengshuiensis]
MGLTPVRDDQIATVVTALEMRAPPEARGDAGPSPVALEHWPVPDSDRYRALFRRVGARWLWFSRLVLAEVELRRILDDPRVEVFAAIDAAGAEIGMVELDFRVAGQCELSYFALVPERTGAGLGPALMAATLARAWRAGVRRVWVHTCTLDHPAALGFYRRQGFVAYKRTVETFADPRVAGVLPADAAPHIPLLAPVSRDAAR